MATGSTENVDTSLACPRCMEKVTKVCGGCKNISYCSSECQQADWHAHKTLCKTFKDFAQPAPAANMRRIVIFLPDEKRPRFMWAPVKRNYSGYDLKGNALAPWENIDKASVIDVDHLMRPTDKIHNAWTGQPLGYAIQVLYDDDFPVNYTDKNKAVASATQGMDAVGWRGPVIAYCGTLRGGDHDALDIVNIQDMDMRAYSHLVAYLIDYYNNTPEQMVRRGPKVKCVKVADSVDRKTSKTYEEVLVPPSHPMFWSQSMLVDVSERLKEPLMTWQCPRTPAKACALSNPEIVYLHTNCDPTLRDDNDDAHYTPPFGFPHKYLLLDVGTQMVARTSGDPLDCNTVDAMVDFCRFHLSPYFQRCAESADFDDIDDMSPQLTALRHKVMEQITPGKWSTYLSQWKAEQADKAKKDALGQQVYTPEKASSGLERMGLTEEDSERIIDILFNFNSVKFDQEFSKMNLGDVFGVSGSKK